MLHKSPKLEKAISLDEKNPQSEEIPISTSVIDSFQAINEAVDFLTSLKFSDEFVLLQFLEVWEFLRTD